MRKKLMGFLLMLCLIVSAVMPVMAEGESKDMQPAIDAYDEMKEVLSNQVGDVEALKAAFDKVIATNEELGLEYEDIETLEAHDSEYWNVMNQAGAIVNMSGVLDEYAQNKNAKTALAVVDLYEELEPDYGQLLAGWFPDIAAIYDEAKQYIPSQDVLDVYEAYEKVQTALAFGYDEDFIIACEEFEAVLDIYNALSEDDMNALAALMGLESGEEAFNQILNDWINANIILELGKVYNAYVAEPNVDTAKALVEKYDSIFGATEMFLPEDFDLFRNAVFCIDDYYKEAKMLLDDASDEGKVDQEEADKDEADQEEANQEEANQGEANQEESSEEEAERGNSPKTGDSSNVMMTFAVMMGAVGVIIAIVNRKAKR